MVALGISRAQPGPATSPLQTLTDLATLRSKELQNAEQANKLRALQSVGQDIATGGNVWANPGIGYLPEVGNMITNRDQAFVNMSHVRAQMTDEASTALGKDMIQLALDPNPTMERWNAIVQAHAEGLTDPLSKANYLARAQDQGRSMLDGLPTAAQMQANPALAQQARDRLKNNILGQVIGSVGDWNAMQSGLTGGPMILTSKDVPYLRPIGGPPGSLVPVSPGGGTPIGGIPPTTTPPVGTAPGAAPAAGGAPANALAPPPSDGSPSYAPGAVTSQPLAPMPVPGAGGGAVTPPPAGSAPQPPPPAPAPGGGGVVPPAGGTGAAPAGAAAAQGGGGTTVQLPSGVTLYDQQRATPEGVPISSADGTPLWTGNLAGRGPQPTGFNLNHEPLWGGQESRVHQSQDVFAKEIEPKFEDAQQILQQTAAVRDAYNTFKRAGGWAQPGPGLTARIDLINKMNVLAGMLHVEGIGGDAASASFQDLQKLQNRMGFAVAESLGHSREAYATVAAATASVPGTESTFTGGQMVNRMIEAQAQRDIEQYQYWSAYGSANQGSFVGANEQFMRDHNPTAVTGKVLQEFGLGPTGFAGGTSQQTNDNIYNAMRKGYITRDQAKNLLAGRGINQPEQRMPGGGVYAPIRPGPPRAE